jgi:hypothetical protein
MEMAFINKCYGYISILDFTFLYVEIERHPAEWNAICDVKVVPGRNKVTATTINIRGENHEKVLNIYVNDRRGGFCRAVDRSKNNGGIGLRGPTDPRSDRPKPP